MDETRCSFAANWTVAGGSLSGSISFESSDWPIEDADASSSQKSPPLLLHPPSPDPCPCEIKICFPQKHEVRQVYVRSSARVYEIYYAPDSQSFSDYLCTVRCSRATKDEELAVDNDDVHHHLKPLDKYVTEEKPGNGSNNNSGNNEDEWVEVKAPDSPPEGSSSLQARIDTNQGKGTEVLYEATAEISDANPCVSLTLRLLSLEDKGCVYVDEIYVFADPVESIDFEGQLGPTGNSAQASLMAMLVPTLMQLSRTSASRIPEKQVSDTKEKHNFKEFGSETLESTNLVDNIEDKGSHSIAVEENVEFQQVCAVTVNPGQLQTPPQVLYTEEKPYCAAKENNMPHGHLESSLDQIVSRLAKVEDLFQRFEEKMLRPINSIEARLQHVEQQLEALNSKPQSSVFASRADFSASEPTCIGSVSNSSYNEENGYPTIGANHTGQVPEARDIKTHNLEIASCSRFFAPEFSGSDSGSFYNGGGDYSVPLDDTSLPVVNRTDKLSILDDKPELEIITHVLPSLTVAAPEFPSADDGKENYALELATDSLGAEQKQTFSIDDALASALAGFLTSYTRQQPSPNLPILTVNAPEFSCVVDSDDSSIASSKVQCGILTDPSVVCETNGAECMNHLTCSDISSTEDEEKNTENSKYCGNKEVGGEVVRQSSLCKEDDRETGVGSEVFGVEQHDETAHEKLMTMENYARDSHQVYIPPLHFLEDETNVSPHSTQKRDNSGKDIIEASEVTENYTGEASCRTRNLSDYDQLYIPPLHFLEDETNASPRGAWEGADYENDVIAASEEVSKEGCEEGILQDVLHISNSLSTVDFEIPILNVEFISRKISCSNSSLEALLTDMQQSTAEPHSVEESDGIAAVSEQQKSVSVVDLEPMGPLITDHQLLCLDNYVHGNTSLGMKDGYVQDNYLIDSNNPEMHSASLL